MKIYNCEQRSDEWFALRLGKVTGTRFKDLVSKRSITFNNLCYKVAAEKITGISSDKKFKVTEAMQHGIDTEEEARDKYELETFDAVETVGFIEKSELFGVSPDGIIGDSKGVEIKCPMPHTHLKYLTSDWGAWIDYRWQIQGSLWVSGFDSWDFVSYCPDFPPEQQLLIETVRPESDDQGRIQEQAFRCECLINSILTDAKERK